jgi:hypothetical protein
MEKGEGLYQEVDVMSLIRLIGNKNKKTQAIILQALEKVISDPEDYKEIRALVLDELNGLTRSFVKATFGNIEFLIR